jgi:hypothetical protein
MRPIDLSKPGAAKLAMDNVRAVAAALGPEGGDPLVRTGVFIAERELKLEVSRPGTGRTYEHEFFVDAQRRLRKGKKRNAPHTASAPGQPPAVDGGELRTSITHEVVDGIGYAGTGLAYGRYLQDGFVSAWGTIVEPRPWASTVAERLPGLLPAELTPIAGQAVTIAVKRIA